MIIDDMKSIFFGAPISFVHEFHKPPYGGGNQFLLALMDAFNRAGHHTRAMSIGRNTRSVLFNSFNFDMDKLRLSLKDRQSRGITTLHRVDGPIAAYRGSGIDIDKAILSINNDLADLTVFQSEYSKKKHEDLGLYFKNSHVIMNAVNSSIFNTKEKVEFPFDGARKIRLVASSWSNNERKGKETYQWLDRNLDFKKFEMTFIGNVEAKFDNIQHIAPLPSQKLAAELKKHDIYITASINDPCSNALIEGLSCGLPAVYKKSGGHPEIVGKAGYGFDEAEEMLNLLDNLVDNFREIKQLIDVPNIDVTAQKYLKLLCNEQ